MPTKQQWLKTYQAGYPSLLLMHFDGSNGGTTFTDSSAYNRTVSVDGNTNTSTAQKKFGTASGYFDGSGDDLYGSYSNLALGAGDFTVDFWIYPTEARAAVLFDTRIKGGAASQPNSLVLYIFSSDRTLRLEVNQSVIITTTAKVSLNTWSHIALIRSGTTITLYINGTSAGSATSSLDFNVQGLTIGRYADAAVAYYKGYYDELHVVAGKAWWTGNFTPPTAAYAF